MEKFHHPYRIQTLMINFICEPTQVIESPNETLFLGMSIRVFCKKLTLNKALFLGISMRVF